MKKLFWILQAAFLYLVTLAASVIPERSVHALGRQVGLLIFRTLAKRRRIAIDNIRQALPSMKNSAEWTCTLETPEEIARETFISLGRSFLEACRLYHGRGGGLIDRIEVRGIEHFEAARAKGKGLIFLTGHCGNWELVALFCRRIFKTSMSVVARRQNNPYLNTMVEKMRIRYDNRIIYKDNALRNMISVIRKNGIIGLLIDQAVSPEEGSLVPFLGRTAWASKAPILIARKTGVSIVPAFIHREGVRHVITINPEFMLEGDISDEGIAHDVKRYSEHIERFITAHPTDWYWVHRRWKRAGELVP
jgi:KDO2-lipid IV(A) lauroyltransferase